VHLGVAHRCQRLAAGRALGHDLDVAVRLEDVAEAGTNDVVVVEQAEPNDHDGAFA
jgi:hypothetical protein